MIEPSLAGVWTSRRFSQLGPASMQLDLHCDCSFTGTVRLFGLMRIRERGFYRAEEGALELTRATGATTRWPFQFEDDWLLLEEAPGEVHAYRRRKGNACRTSGSAVLSDLREH